MQDLLTILVIDDDIDLCESLRKLLIQHSFNVLATQDSTQIQSLLQNNQIDLVLLDIILPGRDDGIALCKKIRSQTTAPIIMLTGIPDDVEKIVALEMGADAYLTKPFNSRVLIAQIKSCLRRQETKKTNESQEKVNAFYQIYIFNDWKLNVTSRTLLSPENKNVKLTSAEYTLLHALVNSPQCVLSRDTLLEAIGSHSSSFDRSVDILISRIRAKIEVNDAKNASMIKTVRNMGYILACDVTKTCTKLG